MRTGNLLCQKGGERGERKISSLLGGWKLAIKGPLFWEGGWVADVMNHFYATSADSPPSILVLWPFRLSLEFAHDNKLLTLNNGFPTVFLEKIFAQNNNSCVLDRIQVPLVLAFLTCSGCVTVPVAVTMDTLSGH